MRSPIDSERIVLQWKRLLRMAGAMPGRPKTVAKALLVLADLRAHGWQRSLRERSSVDAAGRPIPWLAYPAIEWLEARRQRFGSILEFGAGHSTIWLAAHGANVVSFEHDDLWIARLRPRLPASARVVRVGSDEHSYLGELAELAESAFDLIMIDGLHREQCVRAAVALAHKWTLICLDDSQRGLYRSAIEYLHGQGFRSIAFRGHAPIVGEVKETRIFCKSFDGWLDGA